MAENAIIHQTKFLIGNLTPTIDGDKIPSKRQVLQVLIYHTVNINPRKNIRVSASTVVSEIKQFWTNAQLPTQADARCIGKLMQLHAEWARLGKNAGKTWNLPKEKIFSSELDDIFDIAHQDIDNLIKQEQKEFLENQRKTGRIGFISDIQEILRKLAAEEAAKTELLERRRQKSQMELDLIDNFVELASTDEGPSQSLSQRSVGTFSSISYDDDNDNDDTKDVASPPDPKKRRGIINIFDSYKVVAALDRCRVSDRDAVHLVSAIAEALNFDLTNLVLNRSSIRRNRQKVREVKANEIRKNFQETDLDSLVLHFDGKLMYDLLQREMVDRLPVVVTHGQTIRMLGVPKLQDGKGSTAALAVYDVLADWGIESSIKALCCDTTASNLGVKNGAAVLLERHLETKLLLLPCRHHIFELVLRSVFEKKMPGTVGPSVPLFQKFQSCWKCIDQKKYKFGITDRTVRRLIPTEIIEKIGLFTENSLKNLQPRTDYKELLVLTRTFLGLVSSEDVSFRYPGAYHHARWMAKCIYCLKMFLFREEFKMTKEELVAVRDTSIFIVRLYVEAWFTCPVPTRAPSHDLEFFKKLHNYRSIDMEISVATTAKFKNHLWYLNPESAAMAFFDDELSSDVKRRMVENLKSDEDVDDKYPDRFQVDPKGFEVFCEKRIHDFITPQSLNFFARFEIADDFLQVDPTLWNQHRSYQHGLNIVKHLMVVNDAAERGVHLFTQYNNILTRDEDQKQFSLLVIDEYRRKFPDAKKSTLQQKFS